MGTAQPPRPAAADCITYTYRVMPVAGSVTCTCLAATIPLGSAPEAGAGAPASRAMKAISSVSMRPGLGSGVAPPPTGWARQTIAGSAGSNGAFVGPRIGLVTVAAEGSRRVPLRVGGSVVRWPLGSPGRELRTRRPVRHLRSGDHDRGAVER